MMYFKKNVRHIKQAHYTMSNNLLHKVDAIPENGIWDKDAITKRNVVVMECIKDNKRGNTLNRLNALRYYDKNVYESIPLISYMWVTIPISIMRL